MEVRGTFVEATKSKRRSEVIPRSSVPCPWPSVLFHKDVCAVGVQRRGGYIHSKRSPPAPTSRLSFLPSPDCFHFDTSLPPLPDHVSLEQATWLSRSYPLPPTDEPDFRAAIVPHSIGLSLTVPKTYGNLSPRPFSCLRGHVSPLNPNLYVIPKDMTRFVQSSHSSLGSSISGRFSPHPLSQYPGDLLRGKTPSVISM